MTSINHEPLILTEDEYDAQFLPIPAADGNDIWEYAETAGRATTFVWSVVEVDGELFAIPGYHVVNVIGYNVTRNPWPHENVEVRFS